MKIVWEYNANKSGYRDTFKFFSDYVSSAQRLPNGNTLIDEGAVGRIFEVTPDGEIVWEYISPYWGKQMNINMIYRAYRVPYEWVPQLEKPDEIAIDPIDVTTFRVPGAAEPGPRRVIETEGSKPYQGDAALCVSADLEDE